MKIQKLRLIVAALLFFGWLGYLGYAALSKSRGPIVSRAQAAGAQVAVVATLSGDDAPKTATVTEPLSANAPPVGTALDVVNLDNVAGWAGQGEYLLLLEKQGDRFRVVGQQRSPGYDIGGVGKSHIYRWSDDVRAQAKKLLSP
ncbi:MAG TPA: hypothetical protein VMZ71_12195 [Gemmataceae bacterium]|nr:hypothetical protein [Gemmataceae bacterium]